MKLASRLLASALVALSLFAAYGCSSEGAPTAQDKEFESQLSTAAAKAKGKTGEKSSLRKPSMPGTAAMPGTSAVPAASPDATAGATSGAASAGGKAPGAKPGTATG